MFIHDVLLRSSSRRRRRKMQGVDAGMQGVDDRMQPACSLHASLVWPRLNRKSYAGFRLVPTSITLNDLELCNSPYFAFFSPNSTDFQADYITVVEDIDL